MGEKHGKFDETLKLIGMRKSFVTLEFFMKNRTRFVDAYAK